VTSVPARIESGTVVGPYVVDRRLAQGGMSVLYVARDAEGGRVVLKIVSPDIATNATRARLMREARALSLVDHPGVVRIHGTGDHEGTPWIAMDLVHGTDLKRVVERGPLPSETALRYTVQAARALVAAHDAGVIHRDLKPSNLLLTPDGRIVLVDFGIAKPRADARDDDVLTSAREVVGTPAYLSPEQLEHGLVDERSDIWALGCVLFEMVAGVPPFGRGGSATTAAILRDEPIFPPHVPAGVVQVVAACLRKSSFARVASPRELLALLHDVLDSPRLEGTPVTDKPPSSTQLAPSATRPSSAPPSSQGPRRASSPARAMRESSRPPLGSRRPSSLPPAQSSSVMRAAAPRGRIKGTALRAAIAWITETQGERALARVAELASPELQSMLRMGDPALGIMASGWYDVQLVGELLDVFEQAVLPSDPATFVAQLADAVARDNVGGVYRALFRLIASPPLLEANAQRVWQTYVDEGTLSVRIVKLGSFVARVRGWSRHNASVCRIVGPLMQQSLRAIGYNALVVERTQCLADGGTQCVFEGNWVV
jgi:serine/threonine protein kinase